MRRWLNKNLIPPDNFPIAIGKDPRLKRGAFATCIFIVCALNMPAQEIAGNILLLKETEEKNILFEEKRQVKFLKTKSSNPVIRFNPVTLAFASMMFLYQKTLSAQVSADCRFNPSCSSFSKDAIHRFGFVKGIALSADRLTRCNRIAATDAPLTSYDSHFRVKDPAENYGNHP